MALSDTSTLLNSLHSQVRAAIAGQSTSDPSAVDPVTGQTLFQKVDAIFSVAGADVPHPAALPPDAKPGAVVFDTTGKTYADFEAFFAKVGFVPIYDQNGKELGVNGKPIDGGPAENNAAATDPFSAVVFVTLQAPDSTAVLKGTCPADGNYQVEVGEQYDQKMELVQGGPPLVTNPWTNVTLKAGPVQISVAFNPKAVTEEELQARIAAGQGVSKAHYYVRRR